MQTAEKREYQREVNPKYPRPNVRNPKNEKTACQIAERGKRYGKIEENLDDIKAQIAEAQVKLDNLIETINVLNRDMGCFVSFMQSSLSGSASVEVKATMPEKVIQIPTKKVILAEDREGLRLWLEKTDMLMQKVMSFNPGKYRNKNSVRKEILAAMRKDYGFVPEQAMKDVKDKYNWDKRPDVLVALFYTETFKDIFTSKLIDAIGTDDMKLIESNEVVYQLDKIIAPLIEKRKDRSANGVTTWKYIYKYMEFKKNVDWKNHTTRYQNQNKTNAAPPYRYFISRKPLLYKKFKESVKELLEETSNEK